MTRRRLPWKVSVAGGGGWASAVYPKRTRLLITADWREAATAIGCGCGNSELQKLADETGLEIAVCHFPPGTSKWNKIEHRLFSAIS